MARSPTSSPGLRPRSSSSTLPNRFPSRQSTRIITPAKIHGNYIRTSNDNCRSSRQGTQDTSEINLGPSTQNTPIKKRRKQVSGPSTRTISQSSKSRKRPTVSKQNADKHQRVENPEFNQGLTSESDPDEDTRFMDLTQNSDQENAKITAKAQSKKTQGDILSEFDCINLYFFPPDYDRDQELDEEGDQGLGKDTDLNKETKSPDNSSGSGQKLLAILKKIDFVIQRITSSASKRLEFDVWLKKLDKNGPNLIAEYGI
ncbi:hypothetical protein PCASD_20195 [Puccinia coronata f. sp. avenae]|uniref:Uncharacterized protein n=1 Tax=Puccinia coronata f. sp. avenae TaxID=200324 RepID=A0A2N5SMX5_9BASI|nr:hypothetical protein PCASD_20195 [Puccinia coronata f. sp. avenae]